MDNETSKAIGDFIKFRKGMYWGDSGAEELYQALRDSFASKCSDGELRKIAEENVNPHYS
jgi:hypothetical protein